jgi:transcriptional regulator of acetoin/glycerol metabolism
LCAYPWPGNIRELRNVLERALLFADGAILERADLRFDVAATAAASPDTQLTLLQLERNHITDVLREEQGHVERAAIRLGIPRSSLYQKIKRHSIAVSRT